MRLKAARQLQTNPLDVEALTSMHKAQSRVRKYIGLGMGVGGWVQGKVDKLQMGQYNYAQQNLHMACGFPKFIVRILILCLVAD